MRLPFEELRPDFAVIVSIMQNQRPSREIDVAAGGEPIPESLWEKMQLWWSQDPAQRPSAAQIVQELLAMSR
jgi:hypothetical protein